MRYGFVIDHRKCIGCHACTVACKAENDVPLGVYRTWVKYLEKGTFPQTRRFFTVLRCNHCDNAPCVTICPTKALYRRPDGIVDFDPDRCIGCKSCMQACPYDALYIDPLTHTAAKCHFCSHRIDQGLLPACVVVCPEKAIIAGDLDDPTSEIHQLVSRHPVSVRKPEQGTRPKLFYLGVDDACLIPEAQTWQDAYLWAEVVPDGRPPGAKRAEELLPGPASAQVVYDVSHPKPWGWKVGTYLWTKSVASGTLGLAAAFGLLLPVDHPLSLLVAPPLIALFFILLTALLLVWDLKRPERFWFLLAKPNPRSWLVWGAYILMLFGLVAVLWLGVLGITPDGVPAAVLTVGLVVAIAAAGYTAFLFGQAEGRDFWQSPLLLPQLLAQAVVAGASTLLLVGAPLGAPAHLLRALAWTLMGAVLLFAVLVVGELVLPHVNAHVQRTVRLMLAGPYRLEVFGVGLAFGVVVPLLAIGLDSARGAAGQWSVLAAVAALVGLWSYERVWVSVGQDVPLS